MVTAFDRHETGDLQTGMAADSNRAMRAARRLAGKHAGVIAWSREGNPSVGEYGEPTTLFVGGDVSDME